MDKLIDMTIKAMMVIGASIMVGLVGLTFAMALMTNVQL